jgi:hypothetical protein
VICLQLQLAQQTCHHSARELEEGSEYFNPENSQDVIAQISKAVSFYFFLPRVWQKSKNDRPKPMATALLHPTGNSLAYDVS